MGKSNGGFSEEGFSNNRFVLKPAVAIASEVSILSMNSLAITDFHAKKTQHVQLFENALPGTVRSPTLRDTPDVTCPSDFPDSERQKQVVHHEQIPGQPASKQKKNPSDKKSIFTIKAKSIPVTPKTVA